MCSIITPEIYNALPHITEAQHYISEIKPYLDDLGSIFDKHNARDIFSIHLLHKHYNLQPGKVYVYRDVGNIEVCDQTSETDIHGHVYIVLDDGSILPYEYKTGIGPDISVFSEKNNGNHSVFWSNCDASDADNKLVALANIARFDLIDSVCCSENIKVSSIKRITRNPQSNTCLVNSSIVVRITDLTVTEALEMKKLCDNLRCAMNRFTVEHIKSVGTVQGHTYIVSEYIPLRNMEHMTPEQWKEYSSQIKDLIHEIENAGKCALGTICHGDITPANVLVDDKSCIKALVDWDCVSIKPTGYQEAWIKERTPNPFSL